MGDKVSHAFQLSTLCNGAYSVFQIEPTETFIRMLMLILSALAGPWDKLWHSLPAYMIYGKRTIFSRSYSLSQTCFSFQTWMIHYLPQGLPVPRYSDHPFEIMNTGHSLHEYKCQDLIQSLQCASLHAQSYEHVMNGQPTHDHSHT